MTARDILDAALSEADFMAQIKDAAKALGRRVFHCHDSRRSDPDLPDLLMVRGIHLLALECKTETGRVTKEQAAWIAALNNVKIVAADVVRPRDMEAVLETLRTAAR